MGGGISPPRSSSLTNGRKDTSRDPDVGGSASAKKVLAAYICTDLENRITSSSIL